MQLITYDKQTKSFSLNNGKISYIIQIVKGYPVKRYFGRSIKSYRGSNQLENFNHAFAVQGDADPYSLSTLPFEYSTTESGDYRTSAYLAKNKYNQYLPILKFDHYQIIDGFDSKKTELPHFHGHSQDAQSLHLVLIDAQTGLKITLKYTIFADLPILAKWVDFANTGQDTLYLKKATSLQLDINNSDFDLLTLTGAHAHEANVSRYPLHPGKTTIDSNYGSSGPQTVPFACLASHNTTQNYGTAIGTTLLWSGNFSFTADVDQYLHTRLTIGINSEAFEWQLKPDAQFTTPVATLNYATNGLNELSKNFHQLFNNYLVKDKKPHLIAYNTWETTYFDVNEANVISHLNELQQIGIELVVIDDGWFVNRNSEKGQLGDWNYDKKKFPKGLNQIAIACHQHNMQFGLWIEPEMITANSELYHKHPKWILNYIGRTPLTSRNQFILDLSQKIVQDHVIEVIKNLILENHVDFLKWDYNRHFTQPGSLAFSAEHQGEISTRYTLGLYHVLSIIRQLFPNLVIENCSAGGGRLDPGMLYYSDQTWVSDLSDAVYRMEIMNGYSLLFPPSIFSSHITAPQNEQDHRFVPLNSRTMLSSIGITGLECLSSNFCQNDIDKIKEFFVWYKKNRHLLQFGTLYRLIEWPLVNHQVIWLITNQKKDRAFLLGSLGLTDPVHTNKYLPLHYLNDVLQYKINNESIFGGDELNNAGITLPQGHGDFDSFGINLIAQ